MTNIVKRLRTNHPVGTKPDPLLFEAADEIESLRQQQVTWQTEAETTVSSLELEIEKLRQQLVACQARLAGTMGTPDAPPINLNALKRQWQREALLEAAEYCDNQWRWSEAEYQEYEQDVGDGIRRMAKELE